MIKKTLNIRHSSIPTDYLTPSLIFDSDFDSGNLSTAIRVSEYEYELHIRPDTNNIKYFIKFNYLDKDYGSFLESQIPHIDKK